MRRRSHCSAVVCLGGCLAAAAGGVLAEDSVRLTIGQGWAVVSETRFVDLREGEQEFVVADLPAQADLSSLVVRSRRLPLDLLEWERVGSSSGPAPEGAIRAEGDAVTWRPDSPGPAAEPGGLPISVRCRLSSPARVRGLDVEIGYRTLGMGWSAFYQVTVRGEEKDEKEPVSVDLSGVLRIRNGTGRTYSDAVIRIVGGDKRESAGGSEDVGFLLLDDDSPLADRWKGMEPGEEPEFEYAPPRRADVAARSETDIPVVRASRMPASRLYTMTAEDFPLGPPVETRPLRKWIVFRNSAANGLGIPMPPGRVQVFLGSARSQLLEEAWFERSPADGEIRIDLGLPGDVVGSRREAGRTAIAGGHEEVYEIGIRNLRASDIRVEVDEKPPPRLEWSVNSSTAPYHESGQRLRFSPSLEAGAEETLRYALRVSQPRY